MPVRISHTMMASTALEDRLREPRVLASDWLIWSQVGGALPQALRLTASAGS